MKLVSFPRRLLVATLLAVAVLPAAAACAAPPAGFVGMVSEDAFAKPGAYREAQLAAMQAAGVTLLRQTLDWSLIEKRRRHYKFAYYDSFVADAAGHGIQIMPVLFNAPKFASKRPRRHAKRGTYPPKKLSEFGRFAKVAAKRYGPGGSFWAAHPEIKAVPIRVWQIWNEPNLPAYWQPQPAPTQYVAMLAAASKGIRKVDPGAEIVTAGIPESRLGIPMNKFIAYMLDAGAQVYFDTVAVNPYATTGPGVVDFLRQVRQLLDEHGGNAQGLRATEFGWSDKGPSGAFKVDPARQAENVMSAISAMGAAREELKLRGFVYFNWMDAKPYPGGRDFWGLHTGLRTKKGHPKPALQAFTTAIGGL